MITIKDVEHVAKLARLELTEDEKEMYTKQLSDVLKHVDAMNEVDTSNVEPMAHAIDFVNVMRDDEVFYEQTKDELMKNNDKLAEKIYELSSDTQANGMFSERTNIDDFVDEAKHTSKPMITKGMIEKAMKSNRKGE